MINYREKIERYIKPNLLLELIDKNLENLKDKSSEFFINSFFCRKRLRFNRGITGNPKKDFAFFLNSLVQYHLTRIIAEEQRRIILPEVRQFF